MVYLLRLISIFVAGLLLGGSHAIAEENPLSVQGRIIPYQVEEGQIAQVEIDLSLPDIYKAYEDQFKIKVISPEELKITSPKIFPVTEVFDKFSKKNKNVLIKNGKLQAALSFEGAKFQGEQKVVFAVTYQACTETYCLFPKTVNVESFVDLKKPIKESKTFIPLNFTEAHQKGLIWAFVFVFIFGFLTSFTPCIYPMIPITMAILGKEAHARTRWQSFLVSFVYVTGIGVTFSGLGVFAASTGALFGSFMSSPWVLGFIVLVFATMALSMFGVFELQAPEFLRDGVFSKLKLHGYSGIFVSELIAGIIASPCVGPVLVGILTYIAQTKNVFLGFWLMFFYALGMGLIFLFIGISTHATKLLPKSGAWMNRVKLFFGSLLMLAALYYLDILLVSSKVIDKSVVTQLTTSRSSDPSKPNFQIDTIKWEKYGPETLNAAIAAKKPVLIDFRADWCAACLELEEKTFPSQTVQLLSSQFVMVKFDATNESPELEELKKRFEIIGLPTVVFIDQNGQWLKDLTLTEFEDAGKFSKRMETALQRSKEKSAN